MIAFLLKVWGLAQPYRLRLSLGVLTGVLGGLVSPLLIGTIMFVYGAIFPTNSSTYTLTNNIVTLPAFSLSNRSSINFNETFQIPSSANLTLSKSAVSKTNTIYVVALTNGGQSTISNLTIDFDFPTNLVFQKIPNEQLPIRNLPAFAQQWFYNVRAALENGMHTHPWTIALLVAAIPFIMFLRGFLGYLNVYFLQWVASRTVADLRVRLFGHLLNLSAGFYNQNASGQLISRVVNDTGTLQVILNQATTIIVRDPVSLIGILAFLLWQQPKLTLITLVFLPACILPIVIFSRKIRRSSREMQNQSAELTQTMTEAFTGYRIVKAYNLEGIVTAEFQNIARRFVSHYMRIVRASSIPSPLIEFFGSCGIALLLAYLITHSLGHPNPTQFIQLIGSVFMIYPPLKNLNMLQNWFIQAQAASERVFELLATQSAVPEPTAPKLLHADQADIVFETLDFNYGEKPVLRNINLTVKAGRLVALVGASGSGKTTLSNLLLRFYDPVRGAIKIGGVDLRDVRTRDLRNQIAVVTQETILFNDTIRRNIELGRSGATNDEIIAAAKHAYAYDFIMQKPEGFDAIVGEKGATLSGGQRQRLAIARAVLKNAPILILDEATSALDTESERAVQAALDELMKGRTTICIAHRLSTILHADMIVVLDQGRIVETGTHAELVRRGGVYQKLYELQFAS